MLRDSHRLNRIWMSVMSACQGKQKADLLLLRTVHVRKEWLYQLMSQLWRISLVLILHFLQLSKEVPSNVVQTGLKHLKMYIDAANHSWKLWCICQATCLLIFLKLGELFDRSFDVVSDQSQLIQWLHPQHLQSVLEGGIRLRLVP